jgi:ATP sulfurylase
MFIYLLLDRHSPKEEDLYIRSTTVMKVAYFSDVYYHPSFEETNASGDFVASGSIKFYHIIEFLFENYEIQISKTRFKLH